MIDPAIYAWLDRSFATGGDVDSLIRSEYDANMGLIYAVFGDGILFRYYQEETSDDRVRQYVDLTREIASRWLQEEGGSRFGFSPMDYQAVADRIIAADLFLDRMASVSIPAIMLKQGEKRNDVIKIKVEVPGITPNPTTSLRRTEAHFNFGINGSDNSELCGLRDHRVPWLYAFIGESGQHASWIEKGGLDTIYDLFTGKVGELSRSTIEEMENLAWIGLTPQRYFNAGLVIDESGKTNFRASTYRSWKPQLVFQWVSNSFEHETDHLEKRRLARGRPLSGCMTEVTAFTKELVYQGRMGFPTEETERSIGPYIEIALGKGDVQITHLYSQVYSPSLWDSVRGLGADQSERLEMALRGLLKERGIIAPERYECSEAAPPPFTDLPPDIAEMNRMLDQANKGSNWNHLVNHGN